MASTKPLRDRISVLLGRPVEVTDDWMDDIVTLFERYDSRLKALESRMANQEAWNAKY